MACTDHNNKNSVGQTKPNIFGCDVVFTDGINCICANARIELFKWSWELGIYHTGWLQFKHGVQFDLFCNLFLSSLPGVHISLLSQLPERWRERI